MAHEGQREPRGLRFTANSQAGTRALLTVLVMGCS
jgi:hypothetical protein